MKRMYPAVLTVSLLMNAGAADAGGLDPAALDGHFAELSRPGHPGCALGVIEGGRLVHARGYGGADIAANRPITPATPFNLASLSKQFTGAAIALLIAGGKLSEEDDVRRYLPELPDYGEPIRIRHLLHHTSGLRNHMALAAFQPTGPLPTHEEALALVFRQSAVNFRPGTRHQYESPNYVLLAEIVARVSGKPFDRFLDDRIFRPLGMRNTSFASPRLARAYVPAKDGTFRLNEAVNRARGSSGLLSSVEDMTIWLTHLGSPELGGKALLDRMLAGTRLNDGTFISYSYGFQVERDYAGVAGLTKLSHNGQTAAFRSTLTYFPGQKAGVVLLCNVADAPLQKADEIADEWVKTRFEPVHASAASPAGRPLTAQEAARYAGTYLDPVGDELRTFRAEGDTLQFVYSGQGFPLIHLGGGRFAMDGFGEFRFPPSGAGILLAEAIAGQAKLEFARMPADPPASLANLVGRYKSPDVDGGIEVKANGDALTLVTAGGEVQLTSIGGNSFAAPEAGFGHIHFIRNASGKAIGLTLSTLSGISRMRFDRV